MYFIIMENIDLYTIKQNLKTILCVQSRYVDKSLYFVRLEITICCVKLCIIFLILLL